MLLVMRIFRGIIGFVLILIGAFLETYACADAGAMHGWNEFRLERLLSRNLVFALGAPFIVAVGIWTANTGARSRLVPGGLLALVAAGLLLPSAPAHDLGEVLPWAAASAVGALAAVIILARR
jgi:hypothetical protein